MLIHFSDPVSEILRMGAPCFFVETCQGSIGVRGTREREGLELRAQPHARPTVTDSEARRFLYQLNSARREKISQNTSSGEWDVSADDETHGALR